MKPGAQGFVAPPRDGLAQRNVRPHPVLALPPLMVTMRSSRLA